MPVSSRFLWLAVASIAISACGHAESRSKEADRYAPDIEDISTGRASQVEKAFSDILLSRGVLAAGAAVIRNGELVWTGYFGEQSPGTPASKHTMFNVASITKTVAAETILRLAAVEKLSLDESMTSYWVDPDIADDPRHAALTPRVALTHTTGFLNWRFFSPDGKLRLVSDPGEKFGYSGEGFAYLARYVERKLGRDFESLAKQYVFEPSGMANVSMRARGELFDRIAVVTNAKGTYKPFCRPSGWCAPEGTFGAADDMVVTVEDYAAFLIGTMKAQGLTPALAADRERIQAPLDEDFDADCRARKGCPRAQGYGLGWEVVDFGDNKLIGHGGNDWAEVALAYYYTRSRDGLIIFMSGENAAALGAMAEAIALLDPDSVMVARYRRWQAAELSRE